MFTVTWIIRFEGTLTQGPNAGKSFTFATSWAGVTFPSLDKAIGKLTEYRRREPDLHYKIFSRQWCGGRKGRYVEKEVPCGYCSTIPEGELTTCPICGRAGLCPTDYMTDGAERRLK